MAKICARGRDCCIACDVDLLDPDETCKLHNTINNAVKPDFSCNADESQELMIELLKIKNFEGE